MYGPPDEENIYDEWGYHTSNTVMVDFLLPTGIYLRMSVERNSSIISIKKQLWGEAIHYPLFAELTSPEMYAFMYVNRLGAIEEIVTEKRRLTEIDIQPEIPMLKLVKRQGNSEQKRIAQEIKTLAGIKNEMDINRDQEKAHFRAKMRKKAAQAMCDREKLHWKQLLHHHHPPSIEPVLNETIFTPREYGVINVQYENIESMMKLIRIHPKWTNRELMKQVLSVWTDANIHLPTSNPDDYVLVGSGLEYLVGDYPLLDYKILRPYLVKRIQDRLPPPPESVKLILHHVATIRPILPQFGYGRLEMSDIPPVAGRRHKTMQLWQEDSSFYVRVVRTGNVNTKLDNKKLVVQMGVVHGMETLCNIVHTMNPQDGNEVMQTWDENLNFDIATYNLPRTAKLCVAICCIDKKDAKKVKEKKTTPLFWANMNLFDFHGYLKSGKHKLSCWAWPESLDKESLNKRGVVVCNPKDDAPYVEIELHEHPCSLEFPCYEDVMAYAAKLAGQNKEFLQNASKFHITQLNDLMEKPLHDPLFEEDKSILWKLRIDCRDRYPEKLIKLLNAVKWNSYEHVVQMQSLIGSWPPLEPEYALELLDCQYADEQVRKFAINCLKCIRDDQLQQYLLQLVQVIKYEPYIDNPLVEWLLERAWANRKVGHFLFWHLKSELSNAFVGGRFTLILEAYLYGNIPHTDCLHKQHEALMKMKSLNELVKSPGIKQNDVRTAGRHALRQCMNQESYAQSLRAVECPLNPGLILESPVIDPCKVMNSKMRPLWLVFNNANVPEGKVSVIYKNGDDLRQDMLTLQILSIMDSLWKAEGLDLRMIPYGCLSTGEKTGMIEVVTHSNTIANIQKENNSKFMASFKHDTLFDWLKSKNPTPAELETAIQNFTYSCAGYCVATYVLGVGDRHSDNIMVTEKGQLFHIDFGHILGNFKTKYGIKRERVPFVLAHDFVHVINKGKTDTKEDFSRFRKLCDRAFLLLRRRGHLFVTLFSLMLSSGLPELTSEADLNHLRGSLALHLPEALAKKQFKNKFNKATTDAWATSVNWFFHNVNTGGGK